MRFATLYMPDFAVWAVRFFEPDLRERDVLVQLAGKVAARSERLRAEGIERGQAIERARTQAPQAVVRAHPGARTRLPWELVLRALNRLTPWLEPLVSGDFVHRAGDREVRNNVDALAEQGLAVLSLVDGCDPQTVAARLHARLGIASDRATSLLAAFSADADSACVVPAGHEQAFRDQLPLHWLAGAGIPYETRQRLSWLGFRTLGQLQRLSAGQLQAQFPEGRALYVLSRGSDVRPLLLFVPPPAVQAEHIAVMPLLEPAAWGPVLRELLAQAVGRLGDRDAQMVTVTMACDGVARSSRRLCHEPTSELRKLWMLTELAMQDVAPALDEGADAFRVSLEGLTRTPARQERLWDEERAAFEKALADVEKRLPGLSLRVVGLDSDGYLPEESFQLLSTASPPPPPPPVRKAAAKRAQAPAAPRPGATRPGATRANWEAGRAAERTTVSSGPTRLKRAAKRASSGHIRHDGFQLEEPGLLS